MHRAFRRAGAVARSAAILALSCCAAGRTAVASVIINEIHYAPADRTVPEEFIELHNAGASAVPLDGWYFSSGVEWTFPAGTSIAPGEHLVIAANPTVLRARYPAARIVGPFLGRLDNEGEEIVLRNPSGFVEDRVDYQRGFPWPIAGGAQGYSIELIHPALDNDLGGSWRLSNPGAQDSSVIVREGEVWRYFKGTAEPSSPASAWRGRTFGDAAWATGAAPIGYGESFIRTNLADMRDGYSTVYLRKTFTIDDPASVSALVLDVLYDDGFNAWINGRHVAGDNAPSADAAFNATASGALEDLEFNSFSLPRPVDYLVAGSNVLCLQLLNSSLGASSDAFIDARLSRSTGAGAGPTPGAQNSVWATSSPPHLRQVEHTPQVPVNNSPVTVTVKATDADGVASVTLEYQLVDPGAYIALDDPEYSTSWTSVAMNDDGVQGDAIGGDEIFTVVLPRVLQGHRSLVRYRIRAVDGTGLAVSAPYPDDPQPNFAYFVHDGVPGWNGAAQPGSANPILGAVIDYPVEVLRSVRPYFLITKRASTEDCTWFSRYGGDNYLWLGTIVYDGRVYDHVRYRARGGVWRYSMGKNMWKFNFLRGHELEARDDYGRKYDTRWDKLNFSAIIQQGDYLHRGEQGLFESTGFRLFNLVGVASSQTHYATFHIIDEADEFGPTQYDGDLWGLYLVIEQMDGRFLDEVGSSRVDLQACKLEYSIVSPK